MSDFEEINSAESQLPPPKGPEVRKTHQQEFGWAGHNAFRVNEVTAEHYPSDIEMTESMSRAEHMWQLGGVVDVKHQGETEAQPTAVGDSETTFVHPDRFKDYSLAIPTKEGFVTYTLGKEGDSYTVTGPDGQSKIITEGSRISLGRSEQSDIELADSWVSRKHAEFSLDAYGNPILKVTGLNGAILFETPPPTEEEYAEAQEEFLSDAESAVAEAFADPSSVDIVAEASVIAKEALSPTEKTEAHDTEPGLQFGSASELYNALIDGKLPAELEKLIKNAVISKRLEQSGLEQDKKWDQNIAPQVENFAGKGIDQIMDGYTSAITILDAARNDISGSLRYLEEAYRARDYDGVMRITSSFLQKAEAIHQQLGQARYRSKLAERASEESRSFNRLAGEGESLGRQEKMDDADAGLPPEYGDIEEVYAEMQTLFANGDLEAVQAKLRTIDMPQSMKHKKKVGLLMDLEATSNQLGRRFGIGSELEGESMNIRELEDKIEMARRIKRAVLNGEDLRAQLVIDLVDFPRFFTRNINHLLDQLSQAKRSAMSMYDIARELK